MSVWLKPVRKLQTRVRKEERIESLLLKIVRKRLTSVVVSSIRCLQRFFVTIICSWQLCSPQGSPEARRIPHFFSLVQHLFVRKMWLLQPPRKSTLPLLKTEHAKPFKIVWQKDKRYLNKTRNSISCWVHATDHVRGPLLLPQISKSERIASNLIMHSKEAPCGNDDNKVSKFVKQSHCGKAGVSGIQCSWGHCQSLLFLLLLLLSKFFTNTRERALCKRSKECLSPRHGVKV